MINNKKQFQKTNFKKLNSDNSFNTYQELREKPIKYLCSLIDDLNRRITYLENSILKIYKKLEAKLIQQNKTRQSKAKRIQGLEFSDDLNDLDD